MTDKEKHLMSPARNVRSFRKRPRVVLGLAVAAVALTGACSGSAASSDPGTIATSGPHIEIKNFDFQPDPIRIHTGDTVAWTNADDILHTVTSGIGQKQGVPGVSKNTDARPDGLFSHKMDGVGAAFSFTFDKAGTYHYFCMIHPGMRGTIVVN
jgi:plastocyanin